MTLNAQRYQQEVLDAAFIPHSDNQPLATCPIFMDNNARPHRGRVVIALLRSETLPWPARSPDLNPIEHLWDYLYLRPSSGSSSEKLQELEQALHEEKQRIKLPT